MCFHVCEQNVLFLFACWCILTHQPITTTFGWTPHTTQFLQLQPSHNCHFQQKFHHLPAQCPFPHYIEIPPNNFSTTDIPSLSTQHTWSNSSSSPLYPSQLLLPYLARLSLKQKAFSLLECPTFDPILKAFWFTQAHVGNLFFLVVLLWELEFANQLWMASTRILKLEQGCPWRKFGVHSFDTF